MLTKQPANKFQTKNKKTFVTKQALLLENSVTSKHSTVLETNHGNSDFRALAQNIEVLCPHRKHMK